MISEGRSRKILFEQFVDPKLIRTNVVQRSQPASQDVIAALKNLFDGKDISGLLDHTNFPTDALFIAADFTEFLS